jgi:thioredoxin-dependent peroxiredoxin
MARAPLFAVAMAMRLAVGSPAPLFSKPDLRGETVDLAAWTRAGIPVWLGFFRYALCPLCNRRVHEMANRWTERYSARCRFVAVFQSPTERFEGFLTSLPFSVIADPELELYRLYRVEAGLAAALHPQVIVDTVRAKAAGFPIGVLSDKDGGALRVPADFIVAADGSLKVAHYGAHVGDSIAFEAVDAALDELTAAGAKS